MDSPSDSDGNDFVSELLEIGVGTVILALRQVNIERRKLVKEVPQAEPFVDAVLDGIESLTPPVSAILGGVISTVGDTIKGDAGEQLHEAGLMVASIGPELLRLSGLTKRD